jgi:hypothetical protein
MNLDGSVGQKAGFLEVYQDVGQAVVKKLKAVLLRRPLIEVLVADFHPVLFIIGPADLSFLW